MATAQHTPDGMFYPSFYLKRSIPVGSPKFRAMIDKQKEPYNWRKETEKLRRATFRQPKWKNEE